MIISALDLHTELFLLGAQVNNPLLDSRYFLPSPEWLAEFVAWLPDVNYVTESFDCENKALRAVHFADKAFVASGRSGCGHSFGAIGIFARRPVQVCGGTITPAMGHAINLTLCSDREFYFSDPATKKYEKAKIHFESGAFRRSVILWVQNAKETRSRSFARCQSAGDVLAA